jgi:hypothetical protein
MAEAINKIDITGTIVQKTLLICMHVYMKFRQSKIVYDSATRWEPYLHSLSNPCLKYCQRHRSPTWIVKEVAVVNSVYGRNATVLVRTDSYIT